MAKESVKNDTIVSLKDELFKRKSQKMSQASNQVIQGLRETAADLDIPMKDLIKMTLTNLAGVIYSVEGPEAVEVELEAIRRGLGVLPSEG